MTPVVLLEQLYDAAKPRMYLYYIGGIAFLILGLLDIWLHWFNPLQVGIFLDQHQELVTESVSIVKESNEDKSIRALQSFTTNPRSTMNTAVKPQQIIDKETFDALKYTSPEKSIFNIVYKSDGKRLAYFSFLSVLKYPEVISLIGFSTF